MLPTLQPGQEVVTFNWWKLTGLKVGDLVVVRYQSQEMVKRIQTCHGRIIFVIGDNQSNSLDSRKLGKLPKSAIIGKVVWIKKESY